MNPGCFEDVTITDSHPLSTVPATWKTETGGSLAPRIQGQFKLHSKTLYFKNKKA